MSINRIVLVLLAVLLLSGGGAYAFRDVLPVSEKLDAGGAERGKSASQVQRTARKSVSPELTSSDVRKESGEKGIELRIPGIGYLGTLPRLDFGLELLYGAQSEESDAEKDEAGEVTLRGSLKHRF